MENEVIFQDRKGRTITIREEPSAVEAYDGRKRIGWIEYDQDDDGYEFLTHMSVDEEHMRAGIANEMMRLVADLYGPRIGRPSFNAAGGSSASSSADYFTIEGAALVKSCIEKGILEDTEWAPSGEDDCDT